MNPFLKLFAYTVGLFKGAKAAHAVAGNSSAAGFAGLLLLGAQMGVSAAHDLTAAEKGAANDILGGVAVHDDPATYTAALTDAVAGSALPQPVKEALGIGIHFAAATAIGATAPKALAVNPLDAPPLVNPLDAPPLGDSENPITLHITGEAPSTGGTS